MPRISLDAIRIASPCQEPWAAMTGDDQTRYCHRCQKKVFNLSALSREDAEALVEASTGGTCVRLYRRTDGTVLTGDCPVGRNALRRRLAVLAGAMAAGLLLVITWSTAVVRGSGSVRPVREIEPFRTVIEWIDPTPTRIMVMGEMCPPTMPPAPPVVPPAAPE